MSASIILKNVSINFPIYNINARSLKKRFLRLTTGGKLNNNDDHKCIVIKALDNLSFELNHGDRVALIGHNGAGKSTLLRVLAKIYEPSEGQIQIKGKVSTLLDLMLGIDQESTGYENIIIRGLLLGLSKKEITAKIDQIAEFTELGDYLSVPVRTYSSGMQLRLAFGVATSINPEILLLDEVVGTGDAGFMKKAQTKLDEFIEQSSIMVIASHSSETVKKICNKGIVLQAGSIKYYGSIDSALDYYQTSLKS